MKFLAPIIFALPILAATQKAAQSKTDLTVYR
jgi:hypothetical protein